MATVLSLSIGKCMASKQGWLLNVCREFEQLCLYDTYVSGAANIKQLELLIDNDTLITTIEIKLEALRVYYMCHIHMFHMSKHNKW